MEDEKRYEDISPQNEESPANINPTNSDSDAEGGEGIEPCCGADDIKSPVECDVSVESPAKIASVVPSEIEPSPMDVDYLKQIDGRLNSIVGSEQRLFSEVREMHKLYHSEFAGRLKAMQDELEQYRKIDKGRAYDDILAAIARIYDNYETLADEVAEPKAKKSIRYMLMDIEDLMNVYGMTKLRSNQGEKRNPRHCQVLNRISTDDSSKHDTIAKSYNSGFYIDNRTIIKEMVDIFIYERQPSLSETGED